MYIHLGPLHWIGDTLHMYTRVSMTLSKDQDNLAVCLYACSAGSSACTHCATGTYSAAGASACNLCAVGYTGQADVAGCTACHPGKFKDNVGNSTCTDCPANTYSEAVAADSAVRT